MSSNRLFKTAKNRAQMGRRSILGSTFLMVILTCLFFYAATNSLYLLFGPFSHSASHALQTALKFDLLQPQFSTGVPILNKALQTNNGNRAANPAPAASPDPVRIYMYDLPRKFTYGVIEQYLRTRGALQIPVQNDSELRYPGHQHSAEWWLFSDLLKPSIDRIGSPITVTMDPEEADLFYVPFFSSLSLVVNPVRQITVGQDEIYSDEKMQEELVAWLEKQVYWRRNQGRDHVTVCQDPNALYRVIDKFKNSVLLISDLGRLKAEQASLVKDVILPYSHRINSYSGDVGVEQRDLLLFFMGNRFRKEGGKVRDQLFQVLEDEDDMVIKHGTQSRESRRLATQGMHTSKFCLHPAGDTPSACRLFDAIVSLCVPVVVSDDIELPFEDVIDYSKIAIFVVSSDAVQPGYLASMLRGVTSERILKYQQEIKKVKNYFEYEEPNGAVNEIWRQVSLKLPLIKMMINREKRLVEREVTNVDCSCLCSNHANSSVSGLL